MLSALKRLCSPSPVKQQAYETYAQLVAQSRQPFFYHELQVEDTLDGRFDIIVLHLFMTLARCEREGAAASQSFARYLSEAFFADMDRSLREMGVTDTGVSIRIRKMGEAYYGRMTAYKEALGDEKALAEAIRRNVYRERAVAAEIPVMLAKYVKSSGDITPLQSTRP